MGQLFTPLMIEELVMMRLGSQEVQQKREILKITVRNSRMISRWLSGMVIAVPLLSWAELKVSSQE
jgi:hypothetical protein